MDTNNNVNPEAVETVYKPWHFNPIQLDVTPEIVKRYFMDTPEAVDYLLEGLLKESPWTLDHILEGHRDDFASYICSTIAEDI